MTRVIAELLLILAKVFVRRRERAEREEFKDEVEAIRADPLAEWDRKFGRVRGATRTRQLPPGVTESKPEQP